MTTEKHRFSISLDDETFNVYKRFAQLSSTPLASIVSAMLVEAREQIVNLGVMLQRAKSLEGETAEQRAEFMARIDMGLHRAQAAADLIGSDLVQIAQQPSRVEGVAQATPTRVAGRKKAAHSLIHRNKVPKPIPARVPEVFTSERRKTKK